MFFSRKKPKLSPEQALDAKPVKLVEASMSPTPDGGRLTVPVRPPRIGKWVFKLPEGSTKTFEFDAVGVFVWDNVDGRTSVQQIIKRLAKRYDLNLREAQVPTVKFLEMLIKKGLIGIPIEKS